MKKLFTLLLLGGVLTANAQQVNGGFDEAWEDCQPYTGGSSTTVGKQPVGWTVSHIAGYYLNLGFWGSWTGSTAVASEVIGYDNIGSAVELKNTSTVGKIVPAYLTLGTSWNTANTKAENADGGTFGGIAFDKRPDGLKFNFKRNASNDQPASVIAYLWSGSWIQSDVPVNVANNPTKINMTDRDRNILNMSYAQGGTIESNNGKLIATINEQLTETTTDWKEYFVKFNYSDINAVPEKLNIILAANDYFGNASDVTEGNTLTIDNVSLVYYNTLLSLSYDGYDLDFKEDIFDYNLSDVVYDKSKLSYVKKAIGGDVKENYNETSGILTLLVTGDDGSSNSYELTFKKPYSGEILSISYNGTPIQNFAQGTNHYYSVIGEYSEGCITVTTADEGLSATVTYDATTRIATISVPDSGKDIKYYVKFARESTLYNSKIIISMSDMYVGAKVQGVGVSNIHNNKIDLELSDFELMNINFGDIYVHDISIDSDGNINKTDEISIFGDLGSSLGILPITLKGKIVNNNIECNLDIVWYNEGMPTPIKVSVCPVSTSYILATGISGIKISEIKDGLTNPNCLIYADENASNLPNVIANGVCASMNITDGYELGVPQAFSATNIALNRTFPAGWNTICLPFATSTAMFGTDVKAQAFASADDNGLNFAEVTELDANKPYLIYFPSETTAPIYLSAEVETTTPVALTFGDFTFCGSYEASISMAGKYGVADQEGVQKLVLGGEDSTLKATRAYFTKSGDQPAMININLDGNATGIENIEQNQADIYDIYNLQGQLIRKNATSLKGLAKGIYIVNGKKVMVK